MVKQRFNIERTGAGHQFVIPGTEKPTPVPRTKYTADGSQLVIPGAERISGNVLLNRLMIAPRYFGSTAEQGYAIAQDSLGGMYDFGKGVPQDYGEAAKW